MAFLVIFGLFSLLVVGFMVSVNVSMSDSAREAKLAMEKELANWQALPTVDQYLAEHPHCRTDRGIKCHSCNSTSIKNWGVFHATSEQRAFICNSCGKRLYRNEAAGDVTTSPPAE
ncbi:MAG: hypothetical protein LKM39_11420 [Chiayiivirga sp.]|jgi:hypothetical protein|nr:hypothetical protein [Chiayiivirga sp.]